MHQKTINWSYTEKIRERKRLTSWTCYLQGVDTYKTPMEKKIEAMGAGRELNGATGGRGEIK